MDFSPLVSMKDAWLCADGSEEVIEGTHWISRCWDNFCERLEYHKWFCFDIYWLLASYVDLLGLLSQYHSSYLFEFVYKSLSLFLYHTQPNCLQVGSLIWNHLTASSDIWGMVQHIFRYHYQFATFFFQALIYHGLIMISSKFIRLLKHSMVKLVDVFKLCA